jgi:hypothetical protein
MPKSGWKAIRIGVFLAVNKELANAALLAQLLSSLFASESLRQIDSNPQLRRAHLQGLR